MILNYFYEQIMARLLATAPEIKHIDLYFKQDEPSEEETELPFSRPAVLFEYIPFDYETLGNKKKAADIQFRLHVISDVIQEVDNKTSPTIRNLGHAHLALLDKIDKNLQGFNGVNFGSIGSVGFEPYQPNGQMIKHIPIFKTRLTNTTATIVYAPPVSPPEGVITVANEVTPAP
jgi:hypothetical protein